VMPQQKFASPEEALEHFGIKGMRWGIRKQEPTGPFSDFGQPFSPAQGFGRGVAGYEIRNTDQLKIDLTGGFSDIRPISGYASETARTNHETMLSELKSFRNEYPNVAKLQIEVVPMSHVPDGDLWAAEAIPAAMMNIKGGKVRLIYNDKLEDFSPQEMKDWEAFVPGAKYPGYTSRHEMGHVLAASSNLVPPTWDAMTAKRSEDQVKALEAYNQAESARHRAAFAKHGLPFAQVSRLSEYAKESPAESFAELVGNYNQPELRRKMSPDMQKRAKALMDDVGGKN
jgi:hypothetical protein